MQTHGRRIILAGGSGFLGGSLAKALRARGDVPIILTRTPRKGQPDEVAWDGRTVGDWASQLEGASAVVSLAGRSVDCRYTPEHRAEIIASRVESVRALGESLARCSSPPAVFVQAASLAFYGDGGERVLDETAPPGEGFSADVCRRWEAAYAAVEARGMRKVLLRIGFVLGESGGALGKLTTLTRVFLGGSVGSGRQFISWLHQEDMDRIFLRALEESEMQGVYNATSPEPVTNARFMSALRRVEGRPWSPPTPVWAVRVGARVLGTEAELALVSRRCVPGRLLAEGFRFMWPSVEEALADVRTRYHPPASKGDAWPGTRAGCSAASPGVGPRG